MEPQSYLKFLLLILLFGLDIKELLHNIISKLTNEPDTVYVILKVQSLADSNLALAVNTCTCHVIVTHVIVQLYQRLCLSFHLSFVKASLVGVIILGCIFICLV